MAPVSTFASRAAARDKENRPAPGQVAGKQVKDPNAKVAALRTTPRGPVARQATPIHARTTAASTARTAGNRGLPLAKQVEIAKARELEMQAQLEAMLEEGARAEAEADEAEAAAEEGEQELVNQAAEMLAEFAEKSSVVAGLRAEVEMVTTSLEAQRAMNKELCAKNIVLDREGNAKQQAVNAAQAELDRISQSQEALDEELERQNENCERLKLAAQVQGEQCSADWRRLDAMSIRLAEVAGATPSEEVEKLLSEAAERMSRVKESQLFCENLHQEGPQPRPITREATE